jgi:putative flippase GtrA
MKAAPRRWLQRSWVRFLLVGGFGELLYLGLYALVWQATSRTMTAIAVAGVICLATNAILHARISFRVRFRIQLLLSYLLIQGFCLGLTLAAGWALERVGTSAPVVAMVTLVLWSATSFLLTRRSFRPHHASLGQDGFSEAAGFASRQTSREP